ncbi:unnamed protein product [Orchesella dallaii]|uniref:PDF receptor n=1 Tax=Orchesella dallaii TaxID=48710 RepID=A0ABP1S8V3_9HEXA
MCFHVIQATHCPAAWDGFSCWAPTLAGATATSSCPSFKGSDITKSAFRVCSGTGKWLDKDGIPSSTGWTNYTPCLTPEILEIIRKLGSHDEAETKINIASNTRILEFVGLSLSLAALLLSLLIFYYFRTLRNSRTRLHRHLFIALVIQVAIRLTVYTDQLLTRPIEVDGNGNITKHDNNVRRGIDNTPILCEASYISLEYARTAMFMWMFVEGLFLHNMITVTVFEERLSPIVYPMVGWIVPIPLTVAWAVVTHWQYGHSTCWWGYNFTGYFWILEGPRLAVLMVNLAFLLNILRVLVTKLRQSNSSETQQALKAVKAALVLLPLLGLTNLLNMLDAPLEKSPFQFALWSYTTHLLTSTQGFILAFLYCFRNGEVQMAVRKFVRIRILGNSKHILTQNLSKKPIPMSALDNPTIFHPDSGGVSRMHINQSQRSMHSTLQSSHLTHLHQSSKASPNHPPPPLMVRTYSNGVIKQTTLRVAVTDPHRSGCSPHSNKHNENLRPLLYKRVDESTSKSTTSPIIKPMTSSSAGGIVGAAGDSRNFCRPSPVSAPALTTIHQEATTKTKGEIPVRRIRLAQLSNWRMFIIPELFRRKSNKFRRGNKNEDGTNDDAGSLASSESSGSSSSASPDKEERLEEVFNEQEEIKDDKGKDETCHHFETDSSSRDQEKHVDVDEMDEDEFVSIEMNLESGVSISQNSPRNESSSFCNSGQQLVDNNEIDLDNEETEQLSMEIDIVVK